MKLYFLQPKSDSFTTYSHCTLEILSRRKIYIYEVKRTITLIWSAFNARETLHYSPKSMVLNPKYYHYKEDMKSGKEEKIEPRKGD